MPKGLSFDNSFLALIFNATTMANVAQNATSSPITNLHVSLHTADPGVGNNTATNEATYNAYARVSVVRTTAGWTVSNNTVVPAATISFPASNGTTNNTITNFAVGTLLTGAGVILYTGTVVPNIAVSNGVTPQLAVASNIVET